MLVVISDLHLTDGTAGDHNVSAAAFALFRDEILTLAERKGAKELVFLYLGDVIDLVRTEAWLEEALEDRPWGREEVFSDPSALSDRCRTKAGLILEDIATRAKDQLDALAGRWPKEEAARLASLGIPVRRIYIPGNHDRLYWVLPELRTRIDGLLGLTDEQIHGVTRHAYTSPAYGIVARHGHEFDVWNFEGWREELPTGFVFAHEDYLRVPIGDVIAGEVAARLPWTVRRLLVSANLRDEIVEGVYRRLQDIENVRPLHAAIPWVYYQALELLEHATLDGPTRRAVTEAVELAVRTVFDDFMEIPFVARWLREHDRWTNPLDAADKLQALRLLLAGGVKLGVLGGFLKAYQGLGFSFGSPQLAASAEEPGLRDPDGSIHYAVYGHTHEFLQAPLRTLKTHEKVYFNSGTWRPRYHVAQNGEDFVQWKEMSHLVFYRDDEDPLRESAGRRKGHSFETWTGKMLKRTR